MKPHNQLNALDFGWSQLYAGQHRKFMDLVRQNMFYRLPDHMAIFLRKYIRDSAQTD